LAFEQTRCFFSAFALQTLGVGTGIAAEDQGMLINYHGALGQKDGCSMGSR
jgi:hypothetical protein